MKLGTFVTYYPDKAAKFLSKIQQIVQEHSLVARVAFVPNPEGEMGIGYMRPTLVDGVQEIWMAVPMNQIDPENEMTSLATMMANLLIRTYATAFPQRAIG